MPRQQGSRVQLALAYEASYGVAPASGYRFLPFATGTLGAEQELLASELLGFGRDPAAPLRDALNADGEIVIPMDVEALGFWLKALLGQPTTTGTTPRTHTFQSGAATLPSMAIEMQMPEIPRFAMYTGVMADRLTWTMQRSGLLTATLGLVARNEAVAASTAAGTPTAIALQRFSNFQGAVNRNGSLLGQLVSAEFNWSNNLDRIETVRGDGLIDGADPGMASLTGRLQMRLADMAMINDAIAGTPSEIVAAWSLGANASFTFTAHAVHLSRPRVPVQGPQGVQVTFDFVAARAVSPARMATAVLVNTITGY
jgi:hypothetical protein